MKYLSIRHGMDNPGISGRLSGMSTLMSTIKLYGHYLPTSYTYPSWQIYLPTSKYLFCGSKQRIHNSLENYLINNKTIFDPECLS